MPMNELEMFRATWDREAEQTLKLLRALPPAQYDFRPDAGGRSLGELAWHLAELDAYMSFGIDRGQFNLDRRPPDIERPRTVEALAPGYERVHREAVERICKLTPEDLDRSMAFFTGPLTVREILWTSIVSHGVHHRGQLSLMCRLAGGQAPGTIRSKSRRDGRPARRGGYGLDTGHAPDSGHRRLYRSALRPAAHRGTARAVCRAVAVSLHPRLSRGDRRDAASVPARAPDRSREASAGDDANAGHRDL